MKKLILVLLFVSACFAKTYPQESKTTEFQKTLQAAEAGDAEEMLKVGEMYLAGHGVQASFEKALIWGHKSADLGNSDAMIFLGYIAVNIGEFDDAMDWFKQSGELGNSQGTHNVGLMYYTGQGMPANIAEALLWLRKAADMGNAESMSMLGVMYQRGEGVERDYTTAMAWYEKAAYLGYADAYFNIASLYYNGQGITQDRKMAVGFLEKAADMGLARAMTLLAMFYYEGIEELAKDEVKAFELARKAAELRDIDAMYLLGEMYFAGRGTKQNINEAVKWFALAADAGHADSKVRLETAKKEIARRERILQEARDLIQKSDEQIDYQERINNLFPEKSGKKKR